MKKIGFIGAYDKIDMLIYVAKILELCDKKVLVVDSTINQKARYVIPAINPATTYITDFEGVDVAVGFNDFAQVEQYLQATDELPYDYIMIDIDNPYNIEGFDLDTTDKNYFVTAFDLFSLKRGLQIISLIKNPLKLTKVLYSEYMSKSENDYLDYLSLGYKVNWNDERIYFPLEIGDLSVIAENQRAEKIKFRKLSQSYKEALFALTHDMADDVPEAQIRREIKFLEKGV